MDPANIPTGAVTLLGNLLPVLRALSADNVNPLAVVQLQAIGERFPVSGMLAKMLPEALCRSRSMRISRLQTSVGWLAGDTAAALSQTAGGQAAALLSLALVELCCRNMAGHLLHELALKMLPANQAVAGMSQLSDAAEGISNKLKTLAFGRHHATQVTRIRETYLHLGLELPPSMSATLIDGLTAEKMVDLLDCVQQALRGESSRVYIDGFQGMGTIVSLLTALCPDDLLLMVEGGIIHQGDRVSIVVSIIHKRADVDISLETIVNGSKVSTTFPVAFRNDFEIGRLSPCDHLTMNMEGGLADLLDQLLVTVTFAPRDNIVCCFVDLIAALVCNFPSGCFGEESMFHNCGFQDLLGPRVNRLVREKLELLFGVAPPVAVPNVIPAYASLCHAFESLVPKSACICFECFASPIWTQPPLAEQHCPARRVMVGLQHLLGYAILFLFVHTDMKTVRIIQRPQTKIGLHLCHHLTQHLLLAMGDIPAAPGPGAEFARYLVSDFHKDMCQFLGSLPHDAGPEHNVIGTSSGATSIFPATLGTMEFEDPRTLRYQVVDGRFHDGGKYYKALIEYSHIPPRAVAAKSLLHPSTPSLGLSRIGCHSFLTLSQRPYHDCLRLRVMVRVSGQVLHLSFYSLQLGYIGTAVASPCDHPHGDTVNLEKYDGIIATGVGAPIPPNGLVSVVLTHGDPEAQLLSGVAGVRTMIQGDGCLRCMIMEAGEKGFRMLIQR
ncbi:hypothetical protein QBC46DRAFT_288326 [Diplogelasinospora grovesii]|uniref:Uncharacterized protein n=1 Tax=Diplogelasinospora grovesii TaxID=303347 RepID=A0AAN6N7S8_9PEZI|nr:hypothetical protein QBC46DRAFT_288326 [Diplogelasinospora grovesii]